MRNNNNKVSGIDQSVCRISQSLGTSLQFISSKSSKEQISFKALTGKDTKTLNPSLPIQLLLFFFLGRT